MIPSYGKHGVVGFVVAEGKIECVQWAIKGDVIKKRRGSNVRHTRGLARERHLSLWKMKLSTTQAWGPFWNREASHVGGFHVHREASRSPCGEPFSRQRFVGKKKSSEFVFRTPRQHAWSCARAPPHPVEMISLEPVYRDTSTIRKRQTP